MFYIPVPYKQLSLYSVDGTKNTGRLVRFINDTSNQIEPISSHILKSVYKHIYFSFSIQVSWLFKYCLFLLGVYFTIPLFYWPKHQEEVLYVKVFFYFYSDDFFFVPLCKLWDPLLKCCSLTVQYDIYILP